MKNIQGQGTDEPLSINEYNGDLIIVSNSAILERVGGATNTKNRVRILRVSLNGDVLKEQYYPRNSDQNWSANDVLQIDGDRIIIGGSIGVDTSLFFLEVNAQLDSVNSQYYSSEKNPAVNRYQLTGLSYDETTSKILFGGAEWEEDGEEYTLFGELNASDLSIEETYPSGKSLALPSTAILEDGNGGLIWAYNDNKSALMRSPSKDMNLASEIDNLEFEDASNIITKKLIRTTDGAIFLFGDLNEESTNQRKVFLYQAYSGIEPTYFGEAGENQLNGVKQIEEGFLFAGSTEIAREVGGTQKDFYLSRRGPNGGESFSDSFGSDADEELHDAVMVNDNIYSIGSTVIGIENTLLLIKTDKFGRLVN